MPGVSFDRAVEFYDATRGYSAETAERVTAAIVSHLGVDRTTRFLELGVGTGRIALPFIRAGYDYTGIDLSEPMMDQLRAKLAADPQAADYRFALQQGDVTALPFADSSFDVAIAVHVFHLVADWQAAAREARRVLRPGGVLMIAGDDFADLHGKQAPANLPPPFQVRRRWIEIRRELGMPQSEGYRVRFDRDGELERYLRELGATVEQAQLTETHRPPRSPRTMFEWISQRLYSADWDTPDELHAEAVRRLTEWLAAQPFDPDQEIAVVGQFAAIVARFGAKQ